MEETAIPPLLGVIGHPIAGNPMQFAMERALIAANLEWRFLSFDVLPERLAEAVAGVDALGFRGLAVAPPHSTTILDLVPQHSRTAEIGHWSDAIHRGSDGSLVADNLLADALLQWLGNRSPAGGSGKGVSGKGSCFALLGDTPESRALFATLSTLAPETMFVRDMAPADFAGALEASPAAARSEQSDGRESDDQPESIAAGDAAVLPQILKLNERDDGAFGQIEVLVRGGLTQAASAEAKSAEKLVERLRDDCVVVDLAVCASTSPLLRMASDRGLQTISAIDLLAARAALAFQQWTGRHADRTALQEAFEEYLEI